MSAPKTRLERLLAVIERGGNALPHPATLFALLALLVIVASWVAAQAGLAVQHPGPPELEVSGEEQCRGRPLRVLCVGDHPAVGTRAPHRCSTGSSSDFVPRTTGDQHLHPGVDRCDVLGYDLRDALEGPLGPVRP